MARSATSNLAFLNTREILFEPSNFDLQVYNRIPRDLQATTF